MSQSNPVKIAVETPYGVDYVSEVRARVMSLGGNVITLRRGGRIVKLIVRPQGDDVRIASRVGNPQAFVTAAETDTNPANTWEHKRHVLRLAGHG